MEKNYVVGVDIGGQTSKCGVVDKNGNVLAQTVIRSDNHDVVEPYIAELAEALKKIIKCCMPNGIVQLRQISLRVAAEASAG